MDAEGQVIFFLRRTYPSQYKPRRFWNADFPPYISLFEYKGPSKRKPLKKGLWKISPGDYFRNFTVFIHSTPFRSRICGETWSNLVLPTSLSITECSRRKIKKCEQKKQTTSRGWGRGWEPQLLSTSFPHYFSSIFLRAALHCPNAWNRLLTKAVQSLFMFLSIIRKREYYNFPQVELKMFLERKARATHFLYFRFRLQSEREAYYRNRKREEKDFEKD